MVNKKFFIFIGFVLAIVLAAVVIFFSKNAIVNTKEKRSDTQDKVTKEPIKVKIADISNRIDTFPIFVAQKKGFFAKNGISAEIVQMRASAAIEALTSNETDYSTSIIGAARAKILDDTPVKTVLVLSEKSFSGLYGTEDIKLEEIKIIGVATVLSPRHYHILRFIAENNLSVKIVFPGKTAASAGDLLKKEKVDVAILPIYGFERNNFKLIKTIDSQLTSTGLVVTDEKIKEDPDEIKKVIKSLLSSIDFIKNNPKETKDLIFDFTKLEKNEKNIQPVNNIYATMKENFLGNGIPNKEEGMINLIKFVKAGKKFDTYKDIEKQPVFPKDEEKIFDLQFLK